MDTDEEDTPPQRITDILEDMDGEVVYEDDSYDNDGDELMMMMMMIRAMKTDS